MPALNEKMHDIARRMIETQFDESEKQLIHDINRIKNEMSARGLGQSGITVRRVYDLCDKEIETRAFIVWRAYQRVISAGIDSLTGLAEELRVQVETFVVRETPKLTERSTEIKKLIGMGPSQEIEKAKDRALKKVFAEIDLFVLTLENRSKESVNLGNPSNIVQNITNSTIGANQIGANAAASVHLTIGSQDRRDLIEALKQIRDSVNSIPSLPGCNKEELVELVDEVEVEIKKERPNRLKVSGVLQMIATTIQTIGSMQAAYQALKRALLLCGVILP